MPRRPINPQSAPHEVSFSDQSSFERNFARLDKRIRELEDRSREATSAGGRLLGRRLLTGSGVYTPTPGTTRIHVRMVGGGGGGGGTLTGPYSAGGGGSAGVMLEFVRGDDTSLILGGAYSCGEGGYGGFIAFGHLVDGGPGFDTNLRIGPELIVAKGGLGGESVGSSSSTFAIGGGKTSGSSTTDIMITSQGTGFPGVNINGYFFSGMGGYCPLGTPGPVVEGSDDGVTGTGYGVGGSGASSASDELVGGAGAPGCIIIDEFGA